MTLILTRAQVRQVDRIAIEQFHVPGIVLMENAGRGVADVIAAGNRGGTVVVACGGGNNAGDGFVVARHLDLRGIPVKVFCFAATSRLQGDAATNYRIFRQLGIELYEADDALNSFSEAVRNAELVVDALLGTGACGAPRAPFDEVIQTMNQVDVQRLAIDLPSGLDCDSGEPGQPTVRAHTTCTFVAAKPGLVNESSRPYVGDLHVLDIGIPPRVVELVVD